MKRTSSSHVNDKSCCLKAPVGCFQNISRGCGSVSDGPLLLELTRFHGFPGGDDGGEQRSVSLSESFKKNQCWHTKKKWRCRRRIITRFSPRCVQVHSQSVKDCKVVNNRNLLQKHNWNVSDCFFSVRVINKQQFLPNLETLLWSPNKWFICLWSLITDRGSSWVTEDVRADVAYLLTFYT